MKEMKALYRQYLTLGKQKIKQRKSFFDEGEWTLIQDAKYLKSQGFDILKDKSEEKAKNLMSNFFLN